MELYLGPRPFKAFAGGGLTDIVGLCSGLFPAHVVLLAVDTHRKTTNTLWTGVDSLKDLFQYNGTIRAGTEY